MSMQEVRERLLDAGLRLFTAEGFDAVSVERLRKAAGVSNGSFFHAWPTKAALAAALLARTVGRYQEAVLAGLALGPGAAGARGAVRAKLAWVDAHRDEARFMMDDARGAWFALAAPRLDELNRAFNAALLDWARAAGGPAAALPVETLAPILLGPANMACRMWLAGLKPDTASPLDLAPALEAAAARALALPDPHPDPLPGPRAAPD